MTPNATALSMLSRRSSSTWARTTQTMRTATMVSKTVKEMINKCKRAKIVMTKIKIAMTLNRNLFDQMTTKRKKKSLTIATIATRRRTSSDLMSFIKLDLI